MYEAKNSKICTKGQKVNVRHVSDKTLASYIHLLPLGTDFAVFCLIHNILKYS